MKSVRLNGTMMLHMQSKLISVAGDIYLSRISGLTLDEIDNHIELPYVNYEKLNGDRMGESSGSIRTRDVYYFCFKSLAEFPMMPISGRDWAAAASTGGRKPNAARDNPTRL